MILQNSFFVKRVYTYLTKNSYKNSEFCATLLKLPKNSLFEELK